MQGQQVEVALLIFLSVALYEVDSSKILGKLVKMLGDIRVKELCALHPHNVYSRQSMQSEIPIGCAKKRKKKKKLIMLLSKD